MPRSRDLLQRFRPAGTPGAAASAGVPADRVAELSAELEAVFLLLADAELETRRIRAEGRREAERVRRDAGERARTLVSTAQIQAEADRAAAAARVRERAQGEASAVIDAADREADAVRRRAATRIPALVDQVYSAVRNETQVDRP